MAASARMTITLPAELAGDIARVAGRFGITRSALLVQLLMEPMAELGKLVDMVPPTPSAGDVKRFRGASIELIERVVGEAQEVADALDPNPKLPL